MGDDGDETMMLGEAKEELPVERTGGAVADGLAVFVPAQRPLGAEEKQVELGREVRVRVPGRGRMGMTPFLHDSASLPPQCYKTKSGPELARPQTLPLRGYGEVSFAAIDGCIVNGR
jgi:hypothetical protein